jgi:hypothetical protein
MVPGLSSTWVGVAKQQPLSAPYSLHRYRGLVGVPLTLDEALGFDPSSAEVDRFAGVSWRPEAWDLSGEGGASLLELADLSEREPGLALDAAVGAFGDDRWSHYVGLVSFGTGSVERAIYAGAVGLAHLPDDVRGSQDLTGRV